MRRFILALVAAVSAALAAGPPADASPRKVCHGTHDPRGDECHDPFTQGRQPEPLACHGARRSCGGKCYDPFFQTCHPGGVVCAGAQRPCGDQCYDPVQQDCVHRAHDEPPGSEPADK